MIKMIRNVRCLQDLFATAMHLHGSAICSATSLNTRRCLRTTRLATTSRKFSTNTEDLSSLQVSHLHKRTLVRVTGTDASAFLQGLITNDINLLSGEDASQKSMYTLMLNVQGRVLYDIIIYNITKDPTSPCFLLECDTQASSDFIKIMKKYKIRRKVDISDVSSEMKCWALFPKDGSKVCATSTLKISENATEIVTRVSDPRIPGFGDRFITNSDVDVSRLLGLNAPGGDKENYSKRRFQWGLGEGVDDLPPGNCFPLECNVEFLNGVSFSKGCYIGQELTARTYHTGVTRKRLMPVTITGDNTNLMSADSVANNVGKNSGKFRASSGKFGLALLRLNDVMGKQPLSIRDADKKTLAEAMTSIPSWWIIDNDDELKKAIEKENPQT